ncbi:MAG: hypothetical protein JXN61_07315, partial [Sedimentisphaerales bacterium]|nr:hypothetical protein [Sedimentisphaerales bacterium]
AHVSNPDFRGRPHNTLHYNEASEGLDGMDGWYYNIYDLETKIISRIPGLEHDINVDVRPIDSLTPVDLELSLVSQSGLDITLNAVNDLWCSLPLVNTEPYFADFGDKPITFWEKSIIDPNDDINDPNNYTLAFVADIREAIDKSDFYTSSGKTAKVPFEDFNGTYKSGKPYMYAQERFNSFPGDFNFDGKVNLKDYAFWADSEPIADISGFEGLPDGRVDFHDLALFTRDYLKDSNDTSTWRDFAYVY